MNFLENFLITKIKISFGYKYQKIVIKEREVKIFDSQVSYYFLEYFLKNNIFKYIIIILSIKIYNLLHFKE